MKDKEMKNEEPVIITFNEVEYRAEDLSDAQKDIAMKLNASGKKLARLQEVYDDYVITNDYKNIMIKAFESTTMEVEDGNEEETSSEDNS
jgi:hypothetical protein|tara:strand:- start:303 stop:572 length:270 start_codon:yes stop_codon:yes gene_type:complete